MRFLSCFAWLIFDPNPTLYFAIAREKISTKIMLPMLKLDTNYGFHELFLYWPVDYVTKYDSFTASLEWSLILVVSWFIRYILYRHLQFLNHVIIIKQRLFYLRHMWPILFRTFACFCFVFCCCCCFCCCWFLLLLLFYVCFFCFDPNDFQLFYVWAYLMKVIPEMRREHWIYIIQIGCWM